MDEIGRNLRAESTVNVFSKQLPLQCFTILVQDVVKAGFRLLSSSYMYISEGWKLASVLHSQIIQ